MELDTFLIADSIASPGMDGKYYVNGGGLSRYEVPAIPFPMPFDILVRLTATDDELLSGSHKVRVTLLGPAGVPNIPPLETAMGPIGSLNSLLEGEPRFVQLILSMQAVIVRLGLYHVEVHLNEEKLASIPLPVKLEDNAQVSEHALDWSPVALPGPPLKAASTKRPPPPPKKAKRRR